MTWSAKESAATIYAGPYLIGVGVAGSENSVGECEELRLVTGYTWDEITGGSYTGQDTLVDTIANGIKARASFLMMQTSPTDLLRVMQLATLSVGSTSKSIIPTCALVVGKSMLESAARVRFHKYSVSSLADETQDVIFPKGIIIPTDEEWAADGTQANKIPCVVIGLWDSSSGSPVTIGINAA